MDAGKNVARVAVYPIGEMGEAIPPLAWGGQAEGRCNLARVTDIKTLIAWTSWRVAYDRRRAGYAGDLVDDVEQADSVTGTATEVEGLPTATLDVAIRSDIGFDGVGHVENVADLAAVAEYGNRFA